MQCENFYSLQSTVCFICVLFVFKNAPNFARPLFAMVKIGRREFAFFENIKCTIKINFSL